MNKDKAEFEKFKDRTKVVVNTPKPKRIGLDDSICQVSYSHYLVT